MVARQAAGNGLMIQAQATPLRLPRLALNAH